MRTAPAGSATRRAWTVPRQFSRNIYGNIAPIAALTVLPIFGLIALTLDTRNVINTKSAMQIAADAATIMAAIELLEEGTNEEVKNVAEVAMQQKVRIEGEGLVCSLDTFTIADTRDEVTIGWQCDEPSAVSGAIGKDSMRFLVSATAKFLHGMDGCVLALGEHNWTGVSVTGSADVQLDSCAVISNSRKPQSIDMGGSGALTASCAYAAGGIQNPGTIDTTQCLSPVPYGRPTPDPYADLEMPDDWESWPCLTPVKTGKDSLYMPSGRYCNHVSAKGELELEAGGNFVFDGADLRTKSAWAELRGDQVTLFFTDNAEFENANGGKVHLTSKSDGPYAGVLMYGDRDAMSPAIDIKINGNISSRFEGAIYFPNNDLTFVGGASLDSECTQLIADTVTFSGNSGIKANCETLGARQFGNISDVLLTE